MNAEQIVRALHCLGDVLDRQSTDYPTGGDACYAAADLIESLQAQLVAKDAEIARLTADREALFDRLRRADLDCDLCKHNIAEDCGNPEFDCEICHLDCVCKPCDGTSNWEWRGAEEG